MTAICPTPRRPTPRNHVRPARLTGLSAIGLVVSSIAVAMALVAAAPSPARAADHPAASPATIDATVASDEAAVAASPRDAGLRAALGHAYLRAGRFEAAATTLSDAQTLGDTSSRTVLGLALAQIATGHGRDAVILLDAARDQLPVADLGLALALAGDTGRGVAVLSDALKTSTPSQTLRQNLAYADALDGRWSDARTLAMMDLPADKVDARLTQWAATARPEAYRDRVAALLGAPLREDAGLPASLALAAPAPASAPAPALAANAAAAAPETSASVQIASAAPAMAPRTDAAGELPPIAPAAATAPMAPPADATSANRMAEATPAPPAPVADVPPAPSPAPRHGHHGGHRAPVALASAAPDAAAAPAADAPASPESGAVGTHVIQIGAFLSQSNAERARRAFAHRNPYPGHALAVTQAMVGGKQFWRVTVAGFAAGEAGDACGTLKKHGSACFAYAADHAPTGEALAMATPITPRGHRR